MAERNDLAQAAIDVLQSYIGSANGAPILQSGRALTAFSVSEGAAVNFTFPYDDYFSDTGGTIVYGMTLESLPLPSWLTFNPTTRTLSGTPPNGAAGVYRLKRTATVSETQVTHTSFDLADLTITAGNRRPNVIADFADKVIATGAGGSFDIPAAQLFSDPDGNPLTFSLSGVNGAALPTGVSYTLVSSGTIIRVAYTSQASPGGAYQLQITASDGGLTAKSIFTLTFDDAPSGQFDFTVTDNVEVYLDIVQRSDDPVNNTIIPGSVQAQIGSIRVSSDNLGIFYTRLSGSTATDTVSFTLIDQFSLTSDLNATINNQAIAEIIGQPITITRTQGAATTVNLNNYFSGGVGGIDPTAYEFEDSQGQSLGTSFTVANVWSPSIGSNGVITLNVDASFTGSTPVVYVTAADLNGNRSQTPEPLNVTTNPSVGAGPFPTPGVAGSGPSVCFNFDPLKGYIGARQLANVGKELFRLDNLKNSTKSATERLTDGSLNQTTGIITLAAGEQITLGQIRWAARSAYGNRPDLDAGVWLMAYTATGTASITCSYAFSQVATGRFEYTFTTENAAAQVFLNGGASGGTIDLKTAYIGLKSEEGQLWKNGTGSYLDQISRGHCVRVLDNGHGLGGTRIVRASDVATNTIGIWGADFINTAKRCIPMAPFLSFAKEAEIGIWWPCPWALGAQSIETELYQANDSASRTILTNAAEANAAQIIADMQVEDLAYANYVCDEMDAVGWPENLLFRASSGNEVFNTANGFRPHWDYCLGLGRGLRTLWGSSVQTTLLYAYANAVHAASLAKAFNTVFTSRRPNQHWQMSIDVHTAYGAGAPATRQIKGIQDYNSQYSSAVPITKFRGSPTNYSSGALKYWAAGTGNPFNAPDRATHFSTMISQYNTSPATLYATLKAFMTRTTGARDNNKKIESYHRTHIDIFAAAGMVVDANYEGSSGDNMASADASAYPQVQSIAVNWLRSQECGQAQDDLISKLLALNPDFMITDYGLFNPDYSLPWNTLYPGETFDDVPYYVESFVKYLRDPVSIR